MGLMAEPPMPLSLTQPYAALGRLAAYFAAHDIPWALGGSLSLMFWGVAIPHPPKDLDLTVGLDSLDAFYADNPWSVNRPDQHEGRAWVPADCFAVDLFLATTPFQQQALERAWAMPWGADGATIPLITPLDTMIFKCGHEWYDGRGLETCKAILDWRWARKPTYDGPPVVLPGECGEVTWGGPVRIYPREGE
jgi:hypothetical protein